MKIAILHQDLEYQEEIIQQKLADKGFNVDLLDVRNTTADQIKNYSVILNRVFASVANRNYKDNLTTLRLLEEAEKKGCLCINSFLASKCDYSKSFASHIMNKSNVQNPRTKLITSSEDIETGIEFARDTGYPIVLKRDMGGRANEIYLVKNEEELHEKLLFVTANKEYRAGYILQQFVKSTLTHDYRISIINNKLAFGNTRSLLDDGQGESWIASASMGSVVSTVTPPKEIVDLALRATKAINATMNEVDIIVGADGPYIIENNPTPNFSLHSSTRVKMLDLTISEIVALVEEKYGKNTLTIQSGEVHE